MDGLRDLGRDDPWMESLERSRARREQSRRSASRRRRQQRRRRQARLLPFGGALGVMVLVLVMASGVFAGGGAPGAGRTVQAAAFGSRAGSSQAGSSQAGSSQAGSAGRSHGGSGVGGPLGSGAPPLARATVAGRRTASECRPASATAGYVNPLAGAHVIGERIDQGVDYAGTGTLSALGAGRITYVGASATGWPGAFLEYQLSAGAEAGCFVYYAEGIEPAAGLHVGQTLAAGQPVARIIPGWSTGIELGWGSGKSTVTYAAAQRQWSARSDAESRASDTGKRFSALIAGLGGPAGRAEG